MFEGDLESGGANDPLLANEPKIEGPAPTSVSDKPLSALNYFLFVVVGMGISWAMTDALWLQVPYFQRFQPEGPHLAVHLSISVSAAIILFIPLYVYVEPKLNYRWFMYGMLALEILCCFISTMWWDAVMENAISFVLYIAVFVSAVVGNVFYILLLPYFTRINNYSIAPLTVGAALASTLTSVNALIQRPGSESPLYAPDIFYVIVLCSIIIPSLAAYTFLDHGYLREHRKRVVVAEDNDTQWTCGIPSWWKSIWKYVALYSYLFSCIWGVVAALVPYAMISTSPTGGMDTETEQYVFCMMYVGMVIGSVIVTVWRVSEEKTVWVLTFAVSILFALFLWITFDGNGLWKWEGANILVVVLVFWMGVIYGVLLPTLMINIDERYPTHSLKMNQWMSLVGTSSMLLFVWISYYVTEG